MQGDQAAVAVPEPNILSLMSAAAVALESLPTRTEKLALAARTVSNYNMHLNQIDLHSNAISSYLLILN